MKKSVVILIGIIYVASIALVSFFGLKAKIYNAKVYAERVQILNDYVVDENTGEVKAAYNLLSYPVKVTLDEFSHLEANKVAVANSSQFRLPSTGGIGTGIFTMSGGTLIALAGAVLIRRKKKETEE